MVSTASQTELPLRRYLRHMMRSRDRLYAVVDAARDKDLAFAARDRFGLRMSTLFEGPLAPHLDHVAPHLVGIDLKSEYLELWSGHLGRSAGILLLTEAPTDLVWGHLRATAVVIDEEEEEFFFRFYDPRVLRVYLPTCTGPEAEEFFGPIRRILVESQQPGTMLCCEPAHAGVKIDEKPLQQTKAPETDRGATR